MPAATLSPPEFHFFKLLDTAIDPARADRSAMGLVPLDAYRYCDAITTASAFGWYLFAPMRFALLYDGRDVLATWKGCEGWFPLDKVQFPGFADRFNATVPDHARGLSPPFLSRLPIPGVVQIWTGLILRSAPSWSVLVRPCANVAPTKGFEAFEGILETDHWVGPLFINIRMLRTNVPVEITQGWPIAMAQPVPQAAYSDTTLRSIRVHDLRDLTDADWADYRSTGVRLTQNHAACRGRYAVNNRRRRRIEEPA